MKIFNKLNIIFIITICFILILIPNISHAQQNRSFITLGIGLGEPTGIVGRWHFTPNQAIQADLGFTLIRPFFNNTPNVAYDSDMIKFNLSISYIHNYFLTREWDLPFYLGVGVNFRFDSSKITRFGVKFPTLGIEKFFRYHSLEWSIFFDTSLVINFTPEGEGLFDYFRIIGDLDPDTDWTDVFFDVFNIQFNIGLRFFIPT